MARPWEDRVAEYVDSPTMRRRRRAGDEVTASIEGRTGTYEVAWNPKTQESRCTCPSSDAPCKHAEALRRTWEARPESFHGTAAPAAPEFPAERLVFSDGGAHTWLCPCGKRSTASWGSTEEARADAARHVAGHAVRAGLTADEVRRLAEDVEHDERRERIEAAAAEARELFRTRRHPSMGYAADAVVRKWGLEGDGPRGLGEAGKLFELLERTAPGGSLPEWTDPSEGPLTPEEVAEATRKRDLADRLESTSGRLAGGCVALLDGDEPPTEGEPGRWYDTLVGLSTQASALYA
ncbi:MAG: SWIM zinc finger family protein, partial [Thermoplasmatota archaeon]